MILYCFTSSPCYFCFNFQRSGPHFVVFSSSFFSRFVTHWQLISSVMARFDSWLIMRASTLLALTSWCSANRGASQNASALLSSYTRFGFSGDYQGGTESTRPRSCRTSNKSTFRAALCRVTYLFCARKVRPSRTWATLSGALLHSLHITSPVVSMCVFWQEYSLVELKHPRHCMCWALFPTATTLGNPTLVMQIGLRRLHGCDQTDNLTR